MRLIDADAMKEWLDEYLSVFKKYDKSEVKGFVEHQPSIDIVRCKECRWGKPYSEKQLECDALGLGGLKFPNDFCSYGVKKGADDGTEMF